MKTSLVDVTIRSSERQQLIDMTPTLRDTVRTAGIRNGLVGVFSQHTTAVLIVNEYQDALLEDVHAFLRTVARDGVAYRHNDPTVSDCDRQNATAHLRSLMFSNGIVLPLAAGDPVLGQFQSVILAELDGPRDRSVKIQLIGE